MTDLRASDAPLCCHRFHPLWVGTAGGQLVCGLVRTRTMTDLRASDAPLCCHRFHPLWVGTAGGQLIPTTERLLPSRARQMGTARRSDSNRQLPRDHRHPSLSVPDRQLVYIPILDRIDEDDALPLIDRAPAFGDPGLVL